MSNAVRVSIQAGPKGRSMIFNDPSDALDYLIHQGVSKSVAIKRKPDIGWSWEDLPLTIPWNGTMYTMEVVSNRVDGKIDVEIDSPEECCKPEKDNEGPEKVIRDRFNHVVESINGKVGDKYASKNPALVMHMMDQIRDERQMQHERDKGY